MGHCVITSYSNGTTSHMSWWLRCWVSDTCSTYWLIQFIIILNYILSLFINLVLMCILICHSSIMAANILRIPLPVLWHFKILKNHVLQCHMLCILQCHMFCIYNVICFAFTMSYVTHLFWHHQYHRFPSNSIRDIMWYILSMHCRSGYNILPWINVDFS